MNHFTQIALATALATCSLIAGPANTAAATANSAVLIFNSGPCDRIEVVIFSIDANSNTGDLTASINMFIPISGQSQSVAVLPTDSTAAAANDPTLSAALPNNNHSTPVDQASEPLLAVTENRTAAIICADVSGHGAPRKIASKVPMFAGFVANPSLVNMTWGLATETSLISPAAV